MIRKPSRCLETLKEEGSDDKISLKVFDNLQGMKIRKK